MPKKLKKSVVRVIELERMRNDDSNSNSNSNSNKCPVNVRAQFHVAGVGVEQRREQVQ